MYHIQIIRLLAACLCGFIIGLERTNRSKKAGVRTHVIVACGAALVMIVSKYGFSDVMTDHDPSRIASNIITGIGFLGAGMILVNKRTITGLTTAAGIWTTAGIGMAMGAGLYIIALFTTFLILIAQMLLHSKAKFLREPQLRKIVIFEVQEEGYRKKAIDILKQMEIYPVDIAVEKTNGVYTYSFICEMPLFFDEEEIVSSFPYNSRISAGVE